MDKEIAVYIDNYLSEKPNTQFYIVLDQSEVDRYYAIIIPKSESSADSFLLETTNRYITINKKEFPVILTIDQTFMNRGLSYGRPIRKITLYHSYYILFDLGGTIFKKGY